MWFWRHCTLAPRYPQGFCPALSSSDGCGELVPGALLWFPKGEIFKVTVTPAGFLPNPRLCTAVRVLGGGGGLSFHCLWTESAPWPAVQVTTPGFPNKEIPLRGC